MLVAPPTQRITEKKQRRTKRLQVRHRLFYLFCVTVPPVIALIAFLIFEWVDLPINDTMEAAEVRDARHMIFLLYFLLFFSGFTAPLIYGFRYALTPRVFWSLPFLATFLQIALPFLGSKQPLLPIIGLCAVGSAFYSPWGAGLSGLIHKLIVYARKRVTKNKKPLPSQPNDSI
jgi:hypothetical protein